MIRYLTSVVFIVVMAASCAEHPPQEHGSLGDDAPVDRGCTLEARPAIWLEIQDPSGEDLRPGATAWIRDGALVDTLYSPTGGGRIDSYARAGTYDVFVTHPGYRPWVRKNVVVQEDDCHVRTVRLTARLQPAS